MLNNNLNSLTHGIQIVVFLGPKGVQLARLKINIYANKHTEVKIKR